MDSKDSRKEDFRSPARGGRIPPDAHVIVIGAMKCGTSTLFAYLARHPRIAPSRVKEPEFFSEYQGHGIDVDRYEDLWDFDPDQHRFCVEASTGYTKYPGEPHVPDRMLEAGIDPKLIYAVRHPLDRMESQFNHARIRRTDWAYDDLLDPALLNLSRYYMQMQQFLLRFPDRDRYHVVGFDDLVSCPQATMDDVFRWLGLATIDLPRDLHENRTPEPSRVELLMADVDLSDPLGLVPRSVKDRVKRFLRDSVPAKKHMTEDERDRARAYLARDIELFGETFGFPVERWGL